MIYDCVTPSEWARRKRGRETLRDDFRALRDVWDERGEQTDALLLALVFFGSSASLGIGLAVAMTWFVSDHTPCPAGKVALVLVTGAQACVSQSAAAVADLTHRPMPITAKLLDNAPYGGGFGVRAFLPVGDFYIDPSAAQRCGTKENPCRSMEEFAAIYGYSPRVTGNTTIHFSAGP